MHYLYLIINLANNKVYVGQTINPTTRWSAHKTRAKDIQYPLYKAIRKYTIDNFIFRIIAQCKNQEDADFTETELIIQYDSLVKNGKGYNLEPGGYGNRIISDETKLKQSEIAKTAFASGRIHPMQGKKHTDEAKLKMSLASTGRKHTEETKKKISGKIPWNKGLAKEDNPQTGSKRSLENRETMHKAALKRAKKLTKEQVAIIKLDNRSSKTIATEYNVSRSTIDRAKLIQ